MEKKNYKDEYIALAIFLLIIGLFLGAIAMGSILTSLGIDLDLKTDIFIILIICLWRIFNVTTHEIGHFIFGKAFRYKLSKFSIMGFNWKRENGELKFFIKGSRDIGGSCSMIPTKEFSKKKSLLIIMGGIIFNSLSILLSILVLNLVQLDNKYLKLILIIGIFVQALSVITNLLPLKVLGGHTDGNRFWSIIRNKESGKLLLEILKVDNKLSLGSRFKDLDIDFKIEDFNEDVQLNHLTLALFNYMKAIELENREEIEKNIKFIENHIDKCPEYARENFYGDILYYYSAIERGKEKGEKYYDLCKSGLAKNKEVDGRRIIAAFKVYIEENIEEGKDFCIEGLKIKDNYKYKGQGILEERLIEKILGDI